MCPAGLEEASCARGKQVSGGTTPDEFGGRDRGTERKWMQVNQSNHGWCKGLLITHDFASPLATDYSMCLLLSCDGLLPSHTSRRLRSFGTGKCKGVCQDKWNRLLSINHFPFYLLLQSHVAFHLMSSCPS